MTRQGVARTALFDVRGIPLSALAAGPERDPRAILLAIPGGGYLGSYWEAPAASLLDQAAARAVSVVAVDRPGYGSAAGHPMDLAGQAGVLAALLGQLHAEHPGAPIWIAGHSFGAALAVAIAGRAHGAPVAAIDISGMPLRYAPEIREMLGAGGAFVAADPAAAHLPAVGVALRREMFYGAAGSFDPAVLDHDEASSAPMPVAELADAGAADLLLPDLLRLVHCPVRLGIGAAERCAAVDPATIKLARECLSGCASVEVALVEDAGHNISLHHAGAAYHRDMLDWFERVTLNP